MVGPLAVAGILAIVNVGNVEEAARSEHALRTSQLGLVGTEVALAVGVAKIEHAEAEAECRLSPLVLARGLAGMEVLESVVAASVIGVVVAPSEK